ncbi:MAG: methyltransferase domain-containing protein [Pyrinomonadaceae bacterium MAG19_C2-C3]|nr:methyltransferase domain-containing protein [Pyrinomonadaceae bacterium MAG19_C2-C3]
MFIRSFSSHRFVAPARERMLMCALLLAFTTVGCAFDSQTSSRAKDAAAQNKSAPVKDADRVTRETSEPYTGELSIFEDEGRADRLSINRVMDILRIDSGKSIADIGAASGWFTVLAARRVGDKGKVFAVDINKEYVDHIAKRAKNEKLSNINAILGTEDDPRLPAKSVDAVLILKTYHEIGQPVLVMKNVRAALRPGGRVGIIDRNQTPDNDHGIARDTVVKEAAQAGFRLVDEQDFVKPDGMDYLLVFEAK